MNDYVRLVAWLREHGKKKPKCSCCPYYHAIERGYSTCSEELAEKAADAIEELCVVVESYRNRMAYVPEPPKEEN